MSSMFTTLKQSHEGVYTCKVTLGNQEVNGTETVIVRGTIHSSSSPCFYFHDHYTAPRIRVSIDMDPHPHLGQSHSLKCHHSGAESINPTISYWWTQNNNTMIEQVVGTNSSILYFTHLKLSDAGTYTCTVTVTSSYLHNNISISSVSPYIIYFSGKSHNQTQSAESSVS